MPIKTTSVGAMYMLYEQHNYKRAQNVNTILKRLFPTLEGLSKQELPSARNEIPYDDLRAKVEADLSGFKLAVRSQLIESGLVAEHNVAQYYRDLKDFLCFADRLLGKKTKPELTSAWMKFMLPVDLICPGAVTDVEKLLANGITVIGGYDAAGKSAEDVHVRLGNKRTNLKALVYQCIEHGLESPEEFAREVLKPKEYGRIPILRDKPVNGKTIAFYDNRHMWNVLAPLYAGSLPLWDGHVSRDGLPFGDWPESIQEAWHLVLPMPNDGDAKKLKTYKQRLAVMRMFLGKLVKRGISLEMLAGDLTGKDPLRILLLGIPRHLLDESPDVEALDVLARRIEMNQKLRGEILAAQRLHEGSYEGRAAVPNCFVMLNVEEREAAGQYSSAHALLKLVSKISRDAFDICGPHAKWIEKVKKREEALIKANPSNHERIKREIFRNPDLWVRLVLRQIEIVKALLAEPPKGNREWAHRVKMTYFVTMLLLFPLRIENYLGMKINHNFDPVSYTLHFDPEEVKNGGVLDFTLPENGPLACVRQLARLYLDQAREILLRGRTSRFVFVPDQCVSTTGMGMPEKGFNSPLADYSIEHFSDILPEKIGHLFPHSARHLAATHWVALGRVDRAAQVLGDTVQTVLRNYSDARYAANRELKAYYDAFGDEFGVR